MTSDEEFAAIAKYIRENPMNWSRDRYGACTSYSFGELALLDAPPPPMKMAYGQDAPPPPTDAAGGPSSKPTALAVQGYGIEVTMDDLAALAHSSETGGTNPRLWENAIRTVANEHGLQLKVIPELTEISQPLENLLFDYNQTARNMGQDELWTWDYVNAFVHNYAAFDNDRSYNVQRETMLSSDGKTAAFDENVTARKNESDPIFWS